MAHDYRDIQTEFYEGIDEIFTEMFSDKIEIHLMDVDRQIPSLNIYDEAVMVSEKFYFPPIAVVGSFVESTALSKENEIVFDRAVTIRIPAKQLVDNEIPHETQEDLDYLLKAKFSFKHFKHITIAVIECTTMVADMFQVYTFRGSIPKDQKFSAV